MKVKIKKAEKKYLREIAELMKREFSKPPFKERVTINTIIKSLNYYYKIGEIYIAICEKKIVGVVVFKVEQFWEGPVMIIEDLAVEEDFKKHGIGRELMDFVEKYAKRKNIKAITFLTHKKSKVLNFYKKLGYKVDKNIITLGKKLR